jgi:hypothetical protein
LEALVRFETVGGLHVRLQMRAVELADMAERLVALHLVALVASGWCAGEICGAELSDPGAGPSGTRRCRACRVGWTLVKDGDCVRAVARPWPAGRRRIRLRFPPRPRRRRPGPGPPWPTRD